VPVIALKIRLGRENPLLNHSVNRHFEHKIGEEVEVPLVVVLIAQMVAKRLCSDGSRCLVRDSLEGDVLVPNRLEMLLGPSQRPLDEYMEGCVVVEAPVVVEPALRLDGPSDVDMKKLCIPMVLLKVLLQISSRDCGGCGGASGP
jgi:hypothetical protein